MKRANFRIDSLNGFVFSGFTKGENWNGWACPYFPYEESRKIVEATNEFSIGNARYNEREDVFHFEVSGEVEEYHPITTSEQKLYPIGNGAWIWEEVDTNA